MPVEYKTLKQYAETEYIIKRSRFISYAKPVTTEKEAVEFIESIKQKHWDATHNVYAYSLKDGNIKRYSDDGEPQGTAGMPTLSVLTKEDVTDCVVVVTRYFGGVLLGGGGLVRAYSHSAKLGVDEAQIITLSEWSVYELFADYTYYNKLESLIRDLGGVVESSEFNESVKLTFRILPKEENNLLKKCADITNGKIIPEKISTVIAGSV